MALREAIARAPAGEAGVAIAALAIAAIVCAVLAYRALARIRLIEDTPRAKARSAPQGYVELEGRAQPMAHTPVVAHLTGLPCCWYRYRIEEEEHYHDARGRSHTRWKVISHGASTETFWLEDDTGRVAVDPEGADIHPRYKDVWRSDSLGRGIARDSAFIADFLSTHLGATRYRFTEERINRNDPLYALGLLRNLGAHTNAPTIEDRIRETLRAWKQDQPALHARFDLNQDGKIDDKEWLLARQAARRAAEREHAQALQPTTEGINLLTHPRDGDRPYLLSAYPQTELLQRLRWQLTATAAGFLLLGGAAVWGYSVRFAGG
jgi:hypothetical protein